MGSVTLCPFCAKPAPLRCHAPESGGNGHPQAPVHKYSASLIGSEDVYTCKIDTDHRRPQSWERPLASEPVPMLCHSPTHCPLFSPPPRSLRDSSHWGRAQLQTASECTHQSARDSRESGLLWSRR